MKPTRLLIARPRGFCAGVTRAVQAVEALLQGSIRPIYVRRQIVHNRSVVESLAARGVIFVEELDEVPEGALVVFSAHGVSSEVRADAARRRLHVVDATCPLVTKVHHEALRFAREGLPVVLIGHAGHDEVVGTMGQVSGQVRLVGSVREARALAVPGKRIGLITQTTLSMGETREILAVLQERFPEYVRQHRNDICYATENRQVAVRELARSCQFIIVLGSGNSANSLHLREEAERAGARACRIDAIAEFDASCLEGVDTVGLTAGASTPECLVHEAIAHLVALGIEEVVETESVTENVRFGPPPELKLMK